MGSPRILLVDDDREIVRALSIRLEAAGFETLAAHDGEAGLALIATERPDAVILDIRMPGMDGLTVLARLRENAPTRDLPVLILTANVAEKSRRRAMEMGARYFLEKPCEAKTLVQAVRAAIDGPACGAAAAPRGPTTESGR